MKMSHVRTFPGHLLRRANQISMAIFAEEMAETELTSVQHVALIAIAEYGKLDVTRLAEIIDFDKATIGDVVLRLERKGLLKRTVSESDGRVKLLRLTAAGKALLFVSEQRVEAVQARILDRLQEDERAHFIALLAKLVGGNAAQPEDSEDNLVADLRR
ncbi:hypothetical protein WP12_06790 [Sphingomonas sp. SRS2]|nr:hypothetical protein WP12_06790 [Sphingomonas sp. SRS2]